MSGLFLDRLAHFSMMTPYEALPPQTVHQAKRAVLDLVGCALGGIRVGYNRSVHQYVHGLQGTPEAWVWGSGVRVPAPHAALVNGTKAHHLELDDGHLEAASHPGVSVIPAAIAVGETVGASGRDLIRAVVLGYEVCIRAGLAVAQGIREHGVHGPGMMGALGAATAASLLMGLPEREMAAAMTTAGSLLPVSPYESFVEGTLTKDLYAGWAGFVGIVAAELARHGMNGPHRFLEGRYSVGRLLLHEGTSDTARLLSDLGQPFLIDQIYFKPFAASRAVHPTVTAVLELMETHGFTAADVETVDVETYPFAADLSAHSTLATPISARLNIPYSVAVAIRTGKLGPEAFLPEALADRETLALAERITVSPAARYGSGPTGARSSVVQIRLRDGRVLTREVAHARWDRYRGPSDAELEAKFDSLAEGVMSAHRAPRVKAMLWQLDAQESICHLASCLAGDGRDMDSVTEQHSSGRIFEKEV